MTNDARAVADINVTPLIDVMLVLLIIFMVVVPVAGRGLDTALPRPASPDGEPPPAVALVGVEASTLTLNGRPVLTLDELEAGLRDLLDVRRDRTVFVRAAGGVPYRRVVDVVDTARGAGAERIGLVPDAPARPQDPAR